MLTIESASNPVYTQEDEQAIQLEVKFAEFEAPISFNAKPNDPMAYGVELFDNAKAGMYGTVAPFVAP